ncbi:MAG: response regulator [Candidatus Sulfotelmatobacter sp.]
MPHFDEVTGASEALQTNPPLNSADEIDHQSRPSPTPNHTAIVFVVDDDYSVRESLELLIQFAGWQPLLFASASEFLACPQVLVPSCLILDVSLPGLNGLELQKRIAVERAEMPIIFITGHGDVPMSVEAMKAGAAEFLTKPFSKDVIMSAVRTALDRSRAALHRQEEIRALRGRFALLTPRERDVLPLVVSGMQNKQVGAALGISEITVKAHRGKVMRKMRAKSFAELVSLAARLRLVRPTLASAQSTT